jgi:hypothetical protein
MGGEMSTPDNIQIKPTYIRCIWYYLKIIIFIVLVVKTLELVIEPAQSIEIWVLNSIIYFIILFIISFLLIHNEQKNNLFIISTYGITGPSGILNNERTFINLDNIDVDKSKKQNILRRVLGYRYIYTNTIDKIIINLNLFSQEQIETILSKTNIGR